MNHPITPLASAEVNHDQLKVELVEPDSMPRSSGSPGRHNRRSSKPSASPMSQRRLPSCSHGRTLCSPR
jgi:hypothetical protein